MLEPEVIYKSEDFLVLNKPAGMLVHETNSKIKNPAFAPNFAKATLGKKASAGRQNEKLRWPTLTSWLTKKYPETKKVGDNPVVRPGIVHRLDKDTSGVMVVARNQKTFEYLKNLFQEHEIRKTYQALVYGKMENEKGIIDKPIGIKSGTTKRSVFSEKMKKDAVTEYKVISYSTYHVACSRGQKSGDKDWDFSLLEVKPRTGRTHQIRVHLASIGHPVVNDVLYSKKKPKIGNGRLMLHAMSLEFAAHDGKPFGRAQGKRMRFEAELPEDFKENIVELKV